MRGYYFENGVMVVPVIFRKYYIYTVVSGDTLYSIAQRYNSSAGEMMRVNHLFPPVTDPGLIFPGDVLLVPDLVTTGKVHYVVRSGDTVGNISYRYSTYSDLVAGINNLPRPELIYPLQQLVIPAFIYEVKMGDSLNSIARQYGLSLASIIRANEKTARISGGSHLAGISFTAPNSNDAKHGRLDAASRFKSE